MTTTKTTPDFESEDEREHWEERAAIIQYQGGQPREKAEARATELMLKRRQDAKRD